MSNRVSIQGMGDAIQKMLDAYRDEAIEGTNEAVIAAGEKVVSEIEAGAPKRTGTYAGSWVSKVTQQTTFGTHVTVYSPTRYRIAHLLENGHAKRGGGRVAGRPHIAPAEQKGIQQLEEDIQKALEG